MGKSQGMEKIPGNGIPSEVLVRRESKLFDTFKYVFHTGMMILFLLLPPWPTFFLDRG